MARTNWTLAQRTTLFILFDTYGFDPHSRVWWPIFTTLNGTAREWVTVSEDWRFRDGKDRSKMWKRVDKLSSDYDAEELRVYQQTRANVDAEAARLGIAVPPNTHAVEKVVPAATVATSALPSAPVPAAIPSATLPVATMAARILPAASVATDALPAASVPAATSSTTNPITALATGVLPTASASASLATQGKSRFDGFID
jgi:hypothetical protein